MIDLNVKKQTVNARSVLVRDHTIPCTVKKIYTDVDGLIIDKNAIPATIQKKVPVFLLGEFDRQGGYKIGVQSIAADGNLKYLMTFVNGFGAGPHSVVGFSGLGNIAGQLAIGDVVSVWTDSLLNPGYFIWVVVQNSYASMASIIANLKTTQNDKRIGPVIVTEIHYQADIEQQLSQGIFIIHYSNIGTWKTNSIDPLGMYRSPWDVQEGLVRIPVKPITLDQYFGMSFFMLFDSDQISFDFKVITV